VSGATDATSRVLDALAAQWKVKQVGQDRYRAQCPAHGGEDLNLAVSRGDQGVLLACHSRQCSEGDIAGALGLQRRDLFDRDGRAVYDYSDFKIVRTRTGDNGKSVKPEKAGVMPETRRLWVPEVSVKIEEAETVHLAEGEKSADALARLGARCAATWAGGTGGVNRADLTALAGKDVVIVPDNDEPGLKAARTLTDRLAGIAKTVTVQRVPTRYGNGVNLNDPADLWQAGGTLADLEPVILPAASAGPGPVRIVGRKASEVTPTKLRWLWADRIPLGTLAVFAGRGGEGKSTFALHLAAQLTRGLLAGEREGKPVNVGIASLEDDEAAVTVPRLIGAGADLDRVHLFTTDTAGLLVTLPDSADALAAFILEHELAAVILDPSTSMMDGNHNNRHEVRRALDPLLTVGAATGCTFILVQHLNKGGGNMSDKLAGSAAFRDAARCVLLFAADLDTGERIATFDKGNYSEALAASLSFKIANSEVKLPGGDQTNVGIVAELGESDRDAQTVMNERYQIENPERAQERGEAQAFILDYLAGRGGTALASEVIQAGKAEGFTENQLKKARLRCKTPAVSSEKFGFPGAVIWKTVEDLPPSGATETPTGASGAALTNTAPQAPQRIPAAPQGIEERPEVRLGVLDLGEIEAARAGLLPGVSTRERELRAVRGTA